MMSTGNMIHKVCCISIKSRAYRGLALRAPLLLAACRSSPRNMVPSPSPRRCRPTPGSGFSGQTLLTSNSTGTRRMWSPGTPGRALRQSLGVEFLEFFLGVHCNVDLGILYSLPLLNVQRCCTLYAAWPPRHVTTKQFWAQFIFNAVDDLFCE